MRMGWRKGGSLSGSASWAEEALTPIPGCNLNLGFRGVRFRVWGLGLGFRGLGV